MKSTNGILLDSVTFQYPNGTVALKNISLFVKPQQIIGIVGRNGAGKSTFMKLVNGLLKPQSGGIYIDGIPTTKLKSSELTKKVGVMFQNPEHQLFSNTVEDELDFSLKNLNLSKNEYEKYKQEIIQRLNLEKFLPLSPLNLSGGERKKVSIASILCRKPDYLLFDEPTLGQDKVQRKILESIIHEEKNQGKTIIIITHDIEFAFANTDRIIVFEAGKILADGPTHEILSNDFILNNSSIVETQFHRILKIFRLEWQKKHHDKNIPINLDKVRNFGMLENELIDFLERNIIE